jgi:hypothetical protein
MHFQIENHPFTCGSGPLKQQIESLKQSLAVRDAALGKAKYFLRIAEIGGEIRCLVCHEGNDNETPEHKDNCELKAFLSEIEAVL